METNIDAQMSDLSLGDNEDDVCSADDVLDGPARVRIVYLTEQVSHHPPVSAYYASCPARSLEMTGIDQITAKVSGTTLRVAAGSYNKGIFINIKGGPGEGEKYHITHPIASVNGILRGSFYITVGDSTIITCSGGKSGQMLRTVIEYKDEVSALIGDNFHTLISCSPGLVEPISSLKESFTPTPKAKRITKLG